MTAFDPGCVENGFLFRVVAHECRRKTLNLDDLLIGRSADICRSVVIGELWMGLGWLRVWVGGREGGGGGYCNERVNEPKASILNLSPSLHPVGHTTVIRVLALTITSKCMPSLTPGGTCT